MHDNRTTMVDVYTANVDFRRGKRKRLTIDSNVSYDRAGRLLRFRNKAHLYLRKAVKRKLFLLMCRF